MTSNNVDTPSWKRRRSFSTAVRDRPTASFDASSPERPRSSAARATSTPMATRRRRSRSAIRRCSSAASVWMARPRAVALVTGRL
jgi:hypothetical protein